MALARGSGRFGQLASAASGDREAALRVAGLPAVTQLALGATFACALGADGHAYCRGSNREGTAPDGAPHSESQPVNVEWPK